MSGNVLMVTKILVEQIFHLQRFVYLENMKSVPLLRAFPQILLPSLAVLLQYLSV